MNTIRKLTFAIPFRMYSRGNRFSGNYRNNNESFSDDDFDDFDNEPRNKYTNDEYPNRFDQKPFPSYFKQPTHRPYQQFNQGNRQFNALSNQELSKKIQLDPIVQQEMLKFREFTDQKLQEIYETENVEKGAALLDLYRRHIQSTLSKSDSQSQASNEKSEESVQSDSDSVENEKEEPRAYFDDEIPTEKSDIKETSYVEEIVLQQKEEVLIETQHRV